MTDAPAKPSDQPCRREDAVAVVRALRDRGHVAYFAGGCVRDELLGLTPKDFDVATDATPDRVRAIFPHTQPVGAVFGVVLVRIGLSVVEVATFRIDHSYSDGRRPQAVQFTTAAEQDAARRDFTINGLFFDPIENRVIDFVGGQADLAARVLRAIGQPKQRFDEDYLRMLRAARFAARFGLTIESGTLQAIIENAPRLAQISPERVHDELFRMLTPPTRHRAWEWLWQLRLTGVLFRLLPERVIQPPPTRDMLFPRLAPGRSVGFGLAMAAAGLCYRLAGRPGDIRPLLVRDETRRLVSVCRRTLRMSNLDTEALAGALEFGALLTDASPSLAALKRFLARPFSRDARALMAASAEIEPTIAARAAEIERALCDLEKTDFAPPPLITGDDLIAAGMTPGPAFKRILELVYDEQLEGRLATRDAALKLALAQQHPK